MHAAHLAAGARMVEFAGWHMPVSYSGVLDEHRAVRTGVGLFDVSHMGEFSVRGAAALDLLQKTTCNDVSRIAVGRAQYNALTTPAGTFVDDLLVYRLQDDEFLLVVNAGNRSKDLAWLREHAAGMELSLCDVSADWGLLSIQGPRALETLAPLVDQPLDVVRYYRFIRPRVMGVPCIVSRTGYTGEDGFEVYAPADRAAELWSAILAAGERFEIAPIGLAARDTLRLEAKMALYGNDIDDRTTVLEADLGWIVKLDKGEFVGSGVLREQATHGVRRKLVGFETRGRAVARHGYDVLVDGKPAGRVTSGTHSPSLQRNIGLAYVPVEHSATGTELQVDIRGRAEAIVVVATPFYKRKK
jgi:aminomethyltransferase